MSELTCAGCGGPVEVQHKAGLPPCDLHPPVVAELRMHLSAEITGPVDWPARFRAAAEAADDVRLYYALHGVGAGLHGLTDTDPEQIAAVVRVLLGEEQ